MKKKVFIFIICLIVLFVSVYYFANNYTHKIDFENNQYSNFTIDDFGNYSNIYCQECKTGTTLFPTYTCLAILTYEQPQFEEQLLTIEKYSYLEAPIVENGYDNYIVPENEYTIGDWLFKVVYDVSLPNYMDIIGINTQSKQIAYMSFFDSEINYLCTFKQNENNDYMYHFTKKYFKYDFD